MHDLLHVRDDLQHEIPLRCAKQVDQNSSGWDEKRLLQERSEWE
jgi:hypothetical protein